MFESKTRFSGSQSSGLETHTEFQTALPCNRLSSGNVPSDALRDCAVCLEQSAYLNHQMRLCLFLPCELC